MDTCLGDPILELTASETKSRHKREMDSVDRKILNSLQEDCRLSFNKMANKIGISVGTAYNRIKNLEGSGVIKGYTLIVDSEKLGHTLTAVIFLRGEGSHLAEAENEISKGTNVIAVYDVTGEFDAIVIAKFHDRSHLSTFVKNMAADEFVRRTVTNVSLNTIKEDFRLKLT